MNETSRLCDIADPGPIAPELSSNNKFSPVQCPVDGDRLSSLGTDLCWVPIVQTEAAFELEHFSSALTDILLHPERNTSLILRAEILSDGPIDEASDIKPPISGFRAVHKLTRRLLPRQPQRDPSIDQDCTFYSELNSEDEEHKIEQTSLVVLTPLIDDSGSKLPWYHPPVRHLAFRYTTRHDDAPIIRIEIVHLDEENLDVVVDSSSRLYRTCLGLLETLYRHGKGKATGYKKRVVHDTLVPREEYQDLYLIMRDQFKNIADEWHESTDASKHVFEDISIATFLILLWKHTYPAPGQPSSEADDVNKPWLKWGKPPHGFLDLGCGNGLLVHILRECEYPGIGVDVRARKSWQHYPQSTRDCLYVHPFDPTRADSLFLLPPSARSIGPEYNAEPVAFAMFPPSGGRFIIGNHADEMQPWVPVIAALTDADYLSIPCCAWDFDSRFQMKKQVKNTKNRQRPTGDADAEDEGQGEEKDESDKISPEEEELKCKLTYGEKDGKLGLYASYTLWLASLSRRCGFVVETEALRIPSTRNWSIVGRRRLPTSEGTAEAVHSRVRAIVEEVRLRGLFQARKPEGKAGLGEDEELTIKKDGRAKSSPDRVGHLKGLYGSGSPSMGRFRPQDVTWGAVPPTPPSTFRARPSRLGP